MTRPRNDANGTEFGDWTRRQAEIDSGLGWVATNIDYVWHNYKTGAWMLLEEKRHGAQPKRWQLECFALVDAQARRDPKYHGLHVIVFQHTSPEDGLIWRDKKPISKAGLLAFLRDFKAPL